MKKVDRVEPIEDFVFKGFQNQFRNVFECPVTITNSSDPIQIIKRKEKERGKEISYPYAFISVANIAFGDNLTSHRLSRVGITSPVKGSSENLANRIQCVPVNFEINIRYYTNCLMGAPGSVLSFASKWISAQRLGKLKYDIVYSDVPFSIVPFLEESLNIPTREEITDNVAHYEVEGSLTLKGYISISDTMSTLPVNVETNFSATVGDILEDGSIVAGHTFMEFKK